MRAAVASLAISLSLVACGNGVTELDGGAGIGGGTGAGTAEGGGAGGGTGGGGGSGNGNGNLACPFALPPTIGAELRWRSTDSTGNVRTIISRVEAVETVMGRVAARLANSWTSTQGTPWSNTTWFSVDANCAQRDYSQGATDWYLEIDGPPSPGRTFMNSSSSSCTWSRSSPITVPAGTFSDCFELACGSRKVWYCAGASAVRTSDGDELLWKSW